VCNIDSCRPYLCRTHCYVQTPLFSHPPSLKAEAQALTGAFVGGAEWGWGGGCSPSIEIFPLLSLLRGLIFHQYPGKLQKSEKRIFFSSTRQMVDHNQPEARIFTLAERHDFDMTPGMKNDAAPTSNPILLNVKCKILFFGAPEPRK
jgi:hypothetical protein